MPGVQLAVLGAGLIGERHAAHVAASTEAVLAAVVDPAPVGREIASRLGARWYPDFVPMRAAFRPDGVIVATPTRMHVEHGLACVADGIPALIEKPIADDLADAARLVEAAERAGVALLVGHHRRHNPRIRRAKAIIDSGRLGRIVAVHGFFWVMKPEDYFDTPWRREPGAGPVLTNLIHDVDLLRHLCGNIVGVQAAKSNAVRGHAVEDTCVVLLHFANGALGTVTVSDSIVAPWSWELTTGENPAYPRTDQTCYQIGGTHGALTVPTLETWSAEDARSWWAPLRTARIHQTADDPLRLQIGQFCRVIRGEEAPLVSGREGLATLRVIDAIQRAARSGERVGIG